LLVQIDKHNLGLETISVLPCLTNMRTFTDVLYCGRLHSIQVKVIFPNVADQELFQSNSQPPIVLFSLISTLESQALLSAA